MSATLRGVTDTPTPHSVPYVPGRLGQEPLTADIPVEQAEVEPATGPLPAATPPAPRNRTLLIAALAAGIAVVVTASAIGGILLLRSGKTPIEAVKAATGPSTYRVTGSMSLARGYDGMTTPCGGTGGYKDIRAGAQVSVSDAEGATVAIGRLEAGTVTSGRGCVLPFTVDKVPAGKGFYGIEVSHRGVLRYDEAEFSTRNIDLTLG